MSDEPLSQDDIEKLLAAHAAEQAAAADEPEPAAPAEDAFAGPLPEDPFAAPPPEDPFAAPPPSEPALRSLINETLAPNPNVVPPPLVEAIEYEPLIDLSQEAEPAADIRMLLEVPLQIAVELGRTRLTIRELLELGQGSILELDRHAGEPVDVLVNGQPLARGEVVVIDEDFGIRITDVVSHEERLRSMQR